MKRHPQFNEPQACHFPVFFSIAECYGKENSFSSCTSWILGKNQLCQKKNIYFSIYESNVQV